MVLHGKPKVLVTVESPNQLDESSIQYLRKTTNVDVVESSIYANKEKLLEIIGKYDGVIITSNIPFDRDVITEGERLKVISRFGVGYDRVDVKTAADLGIIVTNTPVNSETVVDTTIGLMFAVSRNIAKADSFIKRGNWEIREERRLFTGTDVFGKNLGIIGLGRIGSILAKRVKCFDMVVSYHDVIRNNKLEYQLGLKFLNFHQLLTQSDFISIHTPLTENTKGLIGEKELKMMKKTTIIINTSRGPVINEKALVMALKEGWIAGAGLDVFENEPIKIDNPLLKLDNVVLTPHIGGGTIECERRVVKTAIENTILVLKGKVPLYAVN